MPRVGGDAGTGIDLGRDHTEQLRPAPTLATAHTRSHRLMAEPLDEDSLPDRVTGR